MTNELNGSRLLAGYIDRATLAAELKVCQRTLMRYEQLPDGLPSTTLGGRKLYRIESVMAWLEKQERFPNPRRRRCNG